MKLNPQQAPLYGECVLTVQLCDEELCDEEEDVEFYLLFSGSSQTHLSSTVRINHVTLQAICPAHDCCEAVRVTLCSAAPGRPAGPVGDERFRFVQDVALDVARLLVSSAAPGREAGLGDAVVPDRCRMPLLQECEGLDPGLDHALRHLPLPPGWSLLGPDTGLTGDPAPEETLLHFEARRGVRHVAVFQLKQPRAREELGLPDKEGLTPAGLTEQRGHSQLQQVLSQVDGGMAGGSTDAPWEMRLGDRVVRHHPALDTYTLTVSTASGRPPPSLQEGVEELRRLIGCHMQSQRSPGPKTKTGGARPGQARPRPPAGTGRGAPAEARVVCETAGGEPWPSLDPPLVRGDGSSGAGESGGGGYEAAAAAEEGWAGPAAAWSAGDGEREAERRGAVTRGSRTEEQRSSLASWEETDTSSRADSDTLGQEGESGAERGEAERAEGGEGGLTGVRAQPKPCGDPQATDMGVGQSQEHPESEGYSEGEEASETEREEEGEGEERTAEPMSTGEEESAEEEEDDEEMEDVQQLLNPAVLGDAGDRCEGGIHDDWAPEPAPPVTGEEEPKSETDGSQQSKETAAGDGGTEAEGERGTERGRDRGGGGGGLGRAAVPAREPAPDSAQTETGNHSEGDNDSAQSPCGAKGTLPQPGTTGESINQSGAQTPITKDCVGLSDNPMGRTEEHPERSEPKVEKCLNQSDMLTERIEECLSQSDPLKESSEKHRDQSRRVEADTAEDAKPMHSPLFLPELTVNEENPTDVMVQTAEHTKCQQLPLPERDITSCSSATEADGEKVSQEEEDDRACDLGVEAASVLWSSRAETFWPPEDTRKTTFIQEVPLPEEEHKGMLLANDGTLSSVGSHCALSVINADRDDWRKEDQSGEEAVTSQSKEPHPQHLSNQGTAEILMDEASAYSWGAAQSHCRGSEANQENQEAEVGSEFTETITGGNDVHSDGQKEEPTSESGVTEAVLCVTDVLSDGQKEETTLGSGVIETVTGGSNVHPDSCTGKTTLGSEFTETVTGGNDVNSGSQPEEPTLGSGVTEIGTCGSDVHSDTEETGSGSEVDTREIDSAATSGPGVICWNDGSSETLNSPTDGEEPTWYSAVDRQPEEELEHVVLEPQVVTHDLTVPAMSCEDPNLDCASTAECHSPSLDPTPELGRGEEECGDVRERKSKSSEEMLTMTATEDVSMANQEDRRGESSSAPVTGAEDEEIHRESDSLSPSCLSVDPPQEKRSDELPESSPCSTPRNTGSCASVAQRDSSSDGDGFFTSDAGVYSTFPKVEVELVTEDSVSEVSVSCSSNEDAASLGPPGSAPDCSAGGRRSWSSEEAQQPGAAGAVEEEEKDRLTEVSAYSFLLRCPPRSPSPFRRHSWGPGKGPEGEAEPRPRRLFSGSLAKGIPTLQRRSYSLECLAMDSDRTKGRLGQRLLTLDTGLASSPGSAERGSVVSLTEDDLGADLGSRSNSLSRQLSAVFRPKRRGHGSLTLPLTKSVSLLAINQRELDGMRPFSSVSGSSTHSISEVAPGSPRLGEEGKTATKVGRTFSYLKSKMYKKTKEKEKDKNRSKEKEKEVKERDKRTLNGHVFSAVSSTPFLQCHQCRKLIIGKEAFNCANCSALVHKPCRDTLPACSKTNMKSQKQQFAVPDSNVLRSKSAAVRERPWAGLAPEENGSRRHSAIRPFSGTNLSKSISISNIAGPLLDEIPLKSLRYLSQSTDSLNKTSKANESTESLTDEGTDMMDGQLMGEFEAEAKELEAESWTFTVDRKYLKHLRKDVIKRQDVIYELMQTEMHHVRTLRTVAEVYSKGLLKEVQLEPQTVERVFPALDELLEIHSGLLGSLLERRREARREGGAIGGFLIRRIGDVLVSQFSGSSAERMKKVYGEFCSRHKEALDFYKELHAKDKRFQAFVRRKMSSPVVRRLGIPECILLVTQRITKYPVLLQRLLQNTKEDDEEHAAVARALELLKEVISAVDGKVREQEQRQRLREVYRRTDSRSIMRTHSGLMFAREDLLRGRRLLHHGPLQLKTSAGRLKDVQALLLSDVFVFLQEKDQKYVFASLDQRSSVLSLHKLIVREVANEERGLFLIAAGEVRPEMVEVHASSREERNAWIQLIQDAVASVGKEEDEGIPSESEEDKRVLETKAKELRDQLRRKDQQIVTLLEEKLKVFQDMGSDSGPGGGGGATFRALAQDTPSGELTMKDALREVESLQALVHRGQGGAGEPVWAHLKPEIISNFDTHQVNNISKDGGRDGETDSPDMQRTESDLKKGGNTNLLQLRKKDSEMLQSVCRVHELLSALQAVVVQQDSLLEEQRNVLSERPSSSPLSSSLRSSSSLIEQEKQRSLEKQRQEVANLQRQQEAHAAERRRRESEWEERDRELTDREARLLQLDEETQRGHGEVLREQDELRCLKEEYQRDLERLREAQRRLERDREQVERELQVEHRSCRAPSTTSEDSLQIPSPVERTLSSSPIRDTLLRMGSLRKGKTLNLFASNPSSKAPGGEGQSHAPGRLLQLTKTKEPKEKKEKKKKKKDKGQHPQPAASTLLPGSEQPVDGEILFC